MNIRNCFTPIVLLILLAGCAVRDRQMQNSAVTASITQPSMGSLITETPLSASTAASPITDTPNPSTWVVVDHWTPANQIRTMLIDRSGDLWAGGLGGLAHWDLDTGMPTVYALRVKPENMNTNVVALAQAHDGAIWAGTFGNGITIFNGTSLESLTTENGLPGNYVSSLTATESGELWADMQKMPYPADPGQDYHFGRFDGKKWIDEVGGGFDWVIASPTGSVVAAYNHPFLGYTFSSEIAMYDEQMWNQLTYFPYEYIDAITVAPDGVIWMATDDHIFRLVGRTLHKLNPPWVGTDFPPVSSIAVAEDGTAWFGFSFASFLEYQCGGRLSDWYVERGVYRYDGKTWTHFTTNDGLVDNKICAIAVDSSGNAWFGSFDKGVSRFDGHKWKTYVIP